VDEFFIYDKFTLVGILREYTYIKWTRRFNDTGEFTMETLATDDMRRYIRAGRILYKGTDGEAVIIEDFTSARDAKGDEILTVTGRFLQCVLERRVFDYTGTAKLSEIVNAIIDQNFISPTNPNRKIPELRRVAYTLANDPTLTVEYAHANALVEIAKLCQANNTGFKVKYNPNSAAFDFSLYEGKKTNAIFTENFKNVLEQDYYERTKQEKTTVIVGGGGNGLIVGDEAVGLGRKEIYVQADMKADEAAALALGNDTRYANRRIASFDTVLNMFALQFPYKTYWDLGDVVTCEDLRWDARITDTVLEVTEYYDKGGLHVTPVFGDTPPAKGGS